MALEETGVSFESEGSSAFIAAFEQAGQAAGGFGSAVESASAGIDVAGEIITGALRAVGEIAVQSLMAAGGAVVDFLVDSFSGALEAEQNMARLGQVIESTGGIAGVTVADAEALADQFKNLAGGSDDAVISIIDMGLRMGTISEEMMPAFIQSTLDLGAVMGDAGKASQLMARAVEDPVGVLGALRKAGILVNETTEAQIKAMVKSGDTAGAYALLMGRVEEATAGAAETMALTTAGQWAIFTETVADAGETIAGAFLPAIMSIGGPILETVVPAISELAGAIGTLFTSLLSGDGSDAFSVLVQNFGLTVTQAQAVFAVIDMLSLGFQNFIGFIQSNMPLMQETFASVWGSIQGVLQGVGDFITVTLLPALATIWGETGIQLPTMQQVFEGVMAGITIAFETVSTFITETLLPALTTAVEWVVANWPGIQAKIEEGWAIVQPILQQTVDFFVNTLIPKFQEVVAWVVEHWPEIQAKIEEVMAAIQTVINTVVTEVVPFFVEKFTEIKAWVDENWPLIQQTIETIITAISDKIHEVVDPLVAFWTENQETIKTVASDAWDFIKLAIDNAILFVEGVIKTTMQIITGDWAGAWETIKTTASDIWENIKTAVDLAVHSVETVVQEVIENLKVWWSGKWTEIQDSVTSIFANIVTGVQTKINEIRDAFTAIDWVAVGSALINSIKDGIGNAVGNLIGAAQNAAQSAYQAILDALHMGSPSKLLIDVGKNTQESMAIGIHDKAYVAADASWNAAIAVGDAARMALSSQPPLDFTSYMMGGIADATQTAVAVASESVDMISYMLGNAGQAAQETVTQAVDMISYMTGQINSMSGALGSSTVAPPMTGGFSHAGTTSYQNNDARQFNLSVNTNRSMQTVGSEFSTMQTLAGLT